MHLQPGPTGDHQFAYVVQRVVPGKRLLAARGVRLPIAAWGTTVTTGRRLPGPSVRVSNIRDKVDIAALPVARSDAMVTLCSALFGDRFVPREDLIAVSLSNVNPQNHLGMALCNFTRIEKAESGRTGAG